MAQFETIMEKIAELEIEFIELESPYQSKREILIVLTNCNLYIAKKHNGRLRVISEGKENGQLTYIDLKHGFNETLKMLEDISKGHY
jgi:hypothetical protein